MASQLEQLANFTKIVADTGEIEQIKKFKPIDATTNPSLLLKAAGDPNYKHLVDDAIQYGTKRFPNDKERAVKLTMDKLAVNFGIEITKIVEGVVSTEVDSRLSFDTQGSVTKARELIALYKEAGIDKNRILIKIASTWEGIRAAEILEREGIHCNMTLLFALPQAAAAAEAKATLISPFVGRITDWYKKETGTKEYAADQDPGVKSVRKIYSYYKRYNYPTIVMGASFRNKGQIIALAGVDKLTISPQLLQELKDSTDPVPRVLEPTENKLEAVERIGVDENTFRWLMNEDPMATDKLAEGIRKFAEDAAKLEKTLLERVSAKL